jgi:hypothetical protein
MSPSPTFCFFFAGPKPATGEPQITPPTVPSLTVTSVYKKLQFRDFDHGEP